MPGTPNDALDGSKSRDKLLSCQRLRLQHNARDEANRNPFDPLVTCLAQADLVKDGGHLYFLRYLEAADAGPPDSRAQAAFVLAVLCRPGGRGQVTPYPVPTCSCEAWARCTYIIILLHGACRRVWAHAHSCDRIHPRLDALRRALAALSSSTCEHVDLEKGRGWRKPRHDT